VAVDNRQEVREFLTTRRARVSPQRAGIPAGSNRRVSGLRRSEVATLADISVEYYAKLERGALAGVSDNVRNGRMDILATNALGRAFWIDALEAPGNGNVARQLPRPARPGILPGLGRRRRRQRRHRAD
jgi:hypothetical protein